MHIRLSSLPRSVNTLALALVLGAGIGQVAAQSHVYTLDGATAGMQFGFSVAVLGDVNGDGYADFVAGAPLDSRLASNAGSAFLFSGRDGQVLFSWRPKSASGLLGYAVASAGDVNRDGTPDVIIGAPQEKAGSARIYSGRNGSLLYTFFGDSPGDWFGVAVAGAGDVNRDGWPDVIVGARLDDNTGRDAGSARLFSGKDGKTLYTFNGGGAGDLFGWSVAGAGDVNADGYGDVIVGATQPSINKPGYARVHSGKNGAVLMTFTGDSSGDRFGVSVAVVGDIDRDKLGDLGVGAMRDDNNGTDSGSVRVFSTRTKRALHTFNGTQASGHMGSGLSPAGDVDGDGYADVLVGSHHDFSNRGGAQVFSGKNGSVLFTFRGDAAADHYGNWVASGDISGDGRVDFVVGSPLGDHSGTDSGYLRVYSGVKMALSTDTHQLSMAAGGKQTFSLDAGSPHGGKPYLLVGTLSGVKPGVALGGGLRLALNPDAYFLFTLYNPNGLIAGSLGFLDGAGRATAKFQLPPGLPQAFVGTRLDHAFVAFGAKFVTFDAASNAVPLTMVR